MCLPLGPDVPLKEEVEAAPSPEGGGDGHVGGGVGQAGVMVVKGVGLDLSYKRSGRRRGGLEAAMEAVSLVDRSPGTAFSRLISPGAAPCCPACSSRVGGTTNHTGASFLPICKR